MSDSEPRRRKSGISFVPILIIVLGLIFLLNNFGILPWEIWQNIWKFWPILLILFGAEVLIGRSSSLRTIFLLLILIFLVPILLILNPLTGNPLATETLSAQNPLGNLTKTTVVLELPSNNLKVTSLERGSDKVLVTAVKYSRLLPKPEIIEDRRFDEVRFTFKQPEKYLPLSGNLGNSVELKLSTLIPHNLFIKSNTGVFDLNLEKLNVQQLEIDSGASQITINYDKAVNNKTFIKVTAAKVTLRIPAELQAEIKADSVIKNIKFDPKRFKLQDNRYTSFGFAEATNKLQIEISGSASSVEIE